MAISDESIGSILSPRVQGLIRRALGFPALLLMLTVSTHLVAQTGSSETVTGPLEGSLSLGQKAYVAELSEDHLASWLASPQSTFQALVENFPQVDSLAELLELSGSGLRWRANTANKLWLNSPSRLSWVVLDLEYGGIAARDFILEMNGIDGVGWFYQDHEGVQRSFSDDFSLARGGRPVLDTKAAMPLTMAPGARYRLHFSALTVTDSKHVSFNLWEAEDFRTDRLQRNLIDGAYFGLVFAVVLFNLFLFAALRQNAYLCFSLFVAASAGVIYVGSGLSLVFGLQNTFPQALPLAYLFQGLVGVFGGLFSMALLNTRETNVALHRFWIAVVALNLGVTPLVMYMARDGGFSMLDAGPTFDIVIAVWLVHQFANLLTLVYYWRRSALAWIWYFGVTMHTWSLAFWPMILNSPIDPIIDPYRVTQLATLINTVLLSGLIAYAFRSEQNSRIEAQRSSVEHLRLAHDEERAKSNFISTLGHDLRAPVQAISHFTQSLKHSLPKEAQAGLEKIDDNVSNISDLIDSMIELSQTEWRGSKPKIGPVQLSDLLAEMKAEFYARAADKGLQFECDTTWCAVYSDRICLSQILRNLIENAIKYTNHGYVRILVQEESAIVRITVEDTGQGIREQDLAHIFEEFYQAENGNVVNNGVGLGLSIVDRLAKHLGIEITVRSTLGRGSQFQVGVEKKIEVEHTQAAKDAGQADAIPGPSVPGTLIGIDVLVIDGSEGKLITPLGDRLIAWGAKVWRFDAFHDAVQHLGRLHSRPQLIMIDVTSYLWLDSATEQPQIGELFAEETPVIILESENDPFPVDRIVEKPHMVARAPLVPMHFRALVQRCIGKLRQAY